MRTLHTEPYLDQLARWPASGHHILAQADADAVVVYQAYRSGWGTKEGQEITLAIWLARAAFDAIQDISAQVRAMKQALDAGGLAALACPREHVYPFAGRA